VTPQAVIVAGGKGTRLSAASEHVPKALVPVAGEPLLGYALRLLQRYSIKDVVICTGHLSEQVRSYASDGAPWGLRIRYSEETTPLGTAGCLRAIEPSLNSHLLVLYADVLMELDLPAFIEAHFRSAADATLAVHPNNHPYDSDLIEADPETNLVKAIHAKPHPPNAWLPNLVNACLYVLSPRMLELIPPGVRSDCAHDLFPRALAAGHRLLAYRTAEYLKDIGTPARLREAEQDIRSGRVGAANRNQPRPAVFLDRDGVLVREVDLLRDPDQLELLPGATNALRRLNQAGWLTVVVTNQPVVARGLCDLHTIERIHRKLETLLGSEGAFVDAIYFCPHHPDRGFPDENPAFKIACNCRKPEIGMVQAAQKDFNIDLSHSFLIGDSTTDLQTGHNAGLRTVLVATGYGGRDGKYSASAEHFATDVGAATDWILTRG
jgi:mannose-1-phosphate guanylyltransferase/phosphomannomutase